jgi:WD40 repeat protein
MADNSIRTFHGNRLGVTSVAFSTDSRYIASGGYDGTVRLWEASTGKEIRSYVGHKDTVTAVAFSPDTGQRQLRRRHQAVGRQLRA